MGRSHFLWLSKVHSFLLLLSRPQKLVYNVFVQMFLSSSWLKFIEHQEFVVNVFFPIKFGNFFDQCFLQMLFLLLSLLYFWDPILSILIMFLISLRLRLFFFMLFPLCTSDEIISTDLFWGLLVLFVSHPNDCWASLLNVLFKSSYFSTLEL